LPGEPFQRRRAQILGAARRKPKPSNIVDLYGPPQRRGKLAPREVAKGNRLLLPTNPKEEK